MNERLDQLQHRFRQQERFSQGYSPLYAALFGTVASWLSIEFRDDIALWLVDASINQPAFDVSNLLAAGLHLQVLQGVPAAAELATFYPSMGGDASPNKLFDERDQENRISCQFKQALRTAILGCKEELRTFIQTYKVQTNETGRGFIWLMPACITGWKNIHLMDLGASAGLNLTAEQRSFRFIDDLSGESLLNLGRGVQDEFLVRVQWQDQQYLTHNLLIPEISSRTGCDIRPFPLKTADDELVLMSFIWADQPARLQRLREGIAAYHKVNKTAAPVALHQAELPDGLPSFLHRAEKEDSHPLIIYNTYVKMYLPQKGVALRHALSRWAQKHDRCVVWLQWEPPKFIAMDLAQEPGFGWLAWTADMWFKGEQQQWHLGWVHPHGQILQVLPGMKNWVDYWQERESAR